MKSVFRILYVLATFLSSSLIAQNFVFRHITSDEGLSTNLVNCIYQDSKGFMWFGTQEGLNRYDGYHIKIYKNEPNNKNSLSYSDINCVLETKNNILLVGTPYGLNVLNLENDSILRLFVNNKDLNSKENNINVIQQINENEIVVGTNNGFALYNLSTRKFKHFKFNIEEGVAITDILVFNDNLFLATSKKGLWVFQQKNEKISRVTFTDEDRVSEGLIGLESINKIEMYAGKIYLATNGFGIYRVDPLSFEIEKQKKFKVNNNDRNYIKDIRIRNNNMYCGTESGFIVYNILNEDTAVYIKNSENVNSLSDDKIRCITFDKNQNVWLGSYRGGVNVSFKSSLKFNSSAKYRTNKFKNLYLTFEDKQKNVWLSGDRQLLMIPYKGNQAVNYNKIIGNFDALSVYQENANIYWFGTYGNGLKRYDASTGKTTSFLSNENGGTILSIVKNNDYILIAAFGDGLFKLNLKDNSILQYKEAEGLESLNLTNLFVDKDRSVWILTDGGGIYHIEDLKKTDNKLKIVKHYSSSLTEPSISSDVVYAMNQDNNGFYWFGTNNGLTFYDGKNFKSFYETDGLANAFIYSILKDSIGNMWMSTNKGITSFNPVQSTKPNFKNYSIKDGLLNMEHNIGAASASEHGNMLFGGANGYNIFRPSQIKDNLNVPPVYITAMLRSGKDVLLDTNIIYKRKLNLTWRENYFQLEVAALDFIDPEKNKYSFKLEGYDEDWSEPSNIRFISYTELPGKEYILKVKASNSDGVWNEVPYELHITIVPPFWKTTWFYVLVFIFGTTAVILFTQWRTRQIKNENKILENKVAERTKELAEKNRDITSSIEYAKRIQEAILPSKDNIFNRLPKSFILYKPKDIVSGDFYWFGEKNGWKIFAVVDCTGHGVPGAFMSMIGHNLMHQIILEKGITNPADILNNLHKGVQESLRQGNNEVNTNDGMDVSIIAINDTTKEYLWAGANRPIVIISNDGEFEKVDGNKYPIGGAQLEIKREFTFKTLKINKPCMVYMSSDGYADQFGGGNGKKFMVRRYHDLLTEIHLKDPHEQRELLNKNFEDWRNEHEQIDDVLVVGIAL